MNSQINQAWHTHRKIIGITTAAAVTMEEVLAAADSAYAALFAVELLLTQRVIEEAALHACVGAKSNPTVATMRCDRLSERTQSANDLPHILPNKVVPLFGVLQSTCLINKRRTLFASLEKQAFSN